VLYRGKVAEKTDEEKELLRDAPQIWNVHIVLNTLHSLIVKTKINDQLAAYKNNEDPTKVAGTFGAEPLYKMLGYFSLVGLLRLQCLLGKLDGFVILPCMHAAFKATSLEAYV
jgi:translation initiation factor 3 subunit L